MASAKSWMEQNDPLIRATADSHRLRFISDNVRNECGIFNATGRNIPALHQRSSACLTVFNIRSLRQHNGICCGILTRRIDHRRPDRPGLYQSTGSRCARSRMGGVLCWSTPVELLNLSSASIFAGGLLPYEAAASVCYTPKPEQDQFLINYAMALGITVVAFPTITNLKTWMKTNEAHLRRTAAAHRLRFVTQNVRWEDGVLVTSAGEETIAHIRNAEGYPSPVLVLCSSSIAHTQFVAQYGRAGSTTDTRVVRGFMDALAAGVRDTAWVGFNAQ
ncbi:hypothetical protein C8J57DRAFT_326349 [Mycena rebaudengoi]|nr:hypothetical protein C8J57DRAFT_326349 [Mycena rebaudengoi]